jgi:aspartate aminotransferase
VALTPLLEGAKGRSALGLTGLAKNLVRSEILTIAYEVRDRIAQGRELCNLTVGDFASREFPLPRVLLDGLKHALDAGHTNYPPANGVPELRTAVRSFYGRRAGLDYPLDSVLVASGARPLIYAAYLSLVEQGDVVLYGTPSWNNDHYAYLTGARAVEIRGRADEGFMPTVDDYKPHLRDARILFFNTPLNPTGTMITREKLSHICEAVLEENVRREREGERPLFVIYDQVYWMIRYAGREHVNPAQLFPELAPYTVLIDAASKSFAATGLRVGWGLGPPAIMARMGAFVSHMGAWAPRAEQMAVAELLNDDAALDAFHAEFIPALEARLAVLHAGLGALADRGHPVSSIAPQGAFYLSARMSLFGKRTAEGKVLETDEDIRVFLIDAAGMAVVPFRCFGYTEDTEGWMRLSVGAVSVADCHRVIERLGRALDSLT